MSHTFKYVVINQSASDEPARFYKDYEAAEDDARWSSQFSDGPFWIGKLEARLEVETITTQQVKLTKENN